MKRKAWLLLAVIPVLLAAYVVKRFVLPASVSGGETSVQQPVRPDSSPAPSPELGAVTAAKTVPQKPVAAARSMPQKAVTAGTVPAGPDAFALLDKQFAARRITEAARYDEMEASIKARILPALDASAAKHQRDMESLDGMNLTADQKNQWLKQFNAQYDKDRLEIKATIQPDLDELALKRKEAAAKWESDRAEKRTRLQEIQTMADNGQMDPVAAKRAQFEILGVALPDSQQEQPAPAEAAAAPSKDGTPVVAAIMETGDNRFCALIGEALVYEGNTVQGYRVRKIQADSVEFEKDGQTFVQKVD